MAAEAPIREFMYGQTQEKDLQRYLWILMADDYPDQMTLELYDDVPMTTRDSGIYHQRTSEHAFIMGFRHLYPVYCNRYGSGIGTYVHGYDDAAADNDFTAV